MLLCSCLALNPHVTRHAKFTLMPLIGNVALPEMGDCIIRGF